MQEFWTVEQVSQFLNMKVKTVYALAEGNSIPHYKFGRLVRFRRVDIENWVAANRRECPARFAASEAKRTMVRKHKANLPIEKLLRKAIDGEKSKSYNSFAGSPTRSKGLMRKEV